MGSVLCRDHKCSSGIRHFQKAINPSKMNPALEDLHSQHFSCLQQLYIWISQRQLTFLDTVQMGLITDMQTYKPLNLVQHLFHNTLYCVLYTHFFFYVYILFFYIHILLILFFLFTIHALLIFCTYALLFLTVSFFLFTFASPSSSCISKSSSTFTLPTSYAQSDDIAFVSLDEPVRMCRESLQLCKTNITLM